MRKQDTIVFACGGTLGHIMPAISMVKDIKKIYPQHKIVFIMTVKEKQYEFINNNKDIDYIYYYNVDGLSRKNPFKNIINLGKIIKSSISIKKVLQNSQLVIGMGGYISAITLKMAKRLNITTIMHEQNTIMGLANKMCLPIVDLILSAFPLNIKRDNLIVIGNPRMKEAQKLEKNLVTNNHIVVTSGTLGSKMINEIIVKFLLSEESYKYYTTVVTGRKYYEEVITKLGNKESKHYLIKPFEDNLLDLLSKANIVISRAGASTIFEIIGLLIPSILIPSPNVTNNHQYHNALFLEQQNASTIIEEKELTLELLNKKIKEVISNPFIKDSLKKIRENYNHQDWLEEVKNVGK